MYILSMEEKIINVKSVGSQNIYHWTVIFVECDFLEE